MKHAHPLQPDPQTSPKLAFLLPDLRGGGAERVMLTLASEFANLGYAPHFLLARAEGELLDQAQNAGFPVTNLKADRLRGVASPLRRWLRQNEPFALIPAMWPLTSIAVWAARGMKVPVITTDHATLSDQYASKGFPHRLALRTSIRATYPLAQANVSVSTGAARDLETLGLLPNHSVTVIHNPIAPPTTPTGRADWPAKAQHRVLSVGSLRWQKDFPTLLHAFRHLLDQGCDAELVILGDGPDLAMLTEIVQSLDLAQRVTLPGFSSDTGAYYATADLFALCSRSEGFANVIVEALSHGLPVVATDCPHGPAEILSNGKCGTLVPVQDAAALAQAMAAALHAPHDPDTSRRRAKDFAPSVAVQKFHTLLPNQHFSNTVGTS
ncbi:glycosyltransferase [Aliiroseovarius sp. S1339]|uniref:glycosyltransferase n=1 Tax=Aliiroseovarius sp. S1339 TaxID=2936990 RepID=UPI0020BF9DAE|nr:glycosyltransferase [Aliiroseovarius sp. S1339]MCK8463450.1 glycosyltransferase [Aliiroseovarius sp. S1339]